MFPIFTIEEWGTAVSVKIRQVSSTPSHQAMEIKTYNKSVSTVAFQPQNKKQLCCWKIKRLSETLTGNIARRREKSVCVKVKTVNCNWKYRAYVKVKFHVFYFICKFEFNLENNFISIIFIIEARVLSFYLYF